MTPAAAIHKPFRLNAIAPYLDTRFSQGLDRTRPLELVPQHDIKGKARDPRRCGSLLYRYTDSGEEALVPNIWYNQTLEMRQDHWKFEVERSDEQLRKTRDELAATEAAARRRKPMEPLENDRDVRLARWTLQERTVVNEKVHQCLTDCLAGKLI